MPGKSYGWRILLGYSPWGRKESDTTERLHYFFSSFKTPPGLLTEQMASGLRTSTPPAGDRQVRAARAEGGNRSPREASDTKLQADFSANQDFLGLWTIDIHREGRRQGTAPQKKHMYHCTPRKPSGWNWGEDKSKPSTGGDSAHQAPRHLNRSELGRVQNAGPTKSAPL